MPWLKIDAPVQTENRGATTTATKAEEESHHQE